MASDIKEAIRRLIYQYTVEGADKVMATQEAVAASTSKTDKASLSLEKSFGNIERRYVDTVRAQQDYQKVQEKVNAAVAQNPELQERANAVLAAAGKHFDNIAAGATKGSVAATVLARTLTRTIGPLALIGVAVAAVSSAIEFMEPIAVRVGTDIYNRFSQAYPAIARLAEGIYNAAKQFIELEHAKAKLEAIDAAMRGVASSAQLAALNLQSVNEKLVSQRGLAEAAQAAERLAQAMLRLAEIHPGVTLDTAKQLELLEGQLNIAKARTDEERLLAQERARVLQLTLEGKDAEEATLIAAKERTIAEENIKRQQEQITTQVNHTSDAVAEVVRHTQEATSAAYLLADGWWTVWQPLSDTLSLVERLSRSMDMLKSQFTDSSGKRNQYVSTYDPLFSTTQKAGLEQTYGAENIEPFFVGVGDNLAGYRIKQSYFDEMRSKSESTINDMIDSMKDLAGSTDALNATMQNALSPYYSQDPRTTKLGFRAGVTGNPDWMVSGASNANPLAAVLGYGATAPGMANGGSFIVGGGYSANDNKIAAFPVASGEQVVVNRNRPGGGASVVNIDNRIIVNGSVDADTMSQLKISRYQQAQRMRAGLAA